MRRVCVLAMAAVAMGLTGGLGDAAAQQGAATVPCTNPAGGASWQINIDFRKATVDANPARITPAEISWFDPKDGGNYTLDRKSGNLLGSVASATGGYFRRGRCDLENGR